MSPKSENPDSAKAPEKEKEAPKADKTKAPKEEELSEEDKTLKEELELCVTRLMENDANLYQVRPSLGLFHSV
jgi:hypothetical protein